MIKHIGIHTTTILICSHHMNKKLKKCIDKLICISHLTNNILNTNRTIVIVQKRIDILQALPHVTKHIQNKNKHLYLDIAWLNNDQQQPNTK